MGKFLLIIFSTLIFINIAYAEQLVLTDIIQKARQDIIMQEAKQKAELAMLKPASVNENNSIQEYQEQNAAEKINLNEFENINRD